MATLPDTSPLLASLDLHRSGQVSLQRQLFEALKDRILSGVIASGARLPATRTLARALSVGRNTVIGAYEQLSAEGYVEARVGEGTTVVSLVPEMLTNVSGASFLSSTGPSSTGLPSAGPSSSTIPRGARQPAPGGRRLSIRGQALARAARAVPGLRGIAFQPGLPAYDNFPFTTWSRLLSRHARARRHDRLGYEESAGISTLRRAIAAHVRASRGVLCDPEQVVVVCGAQAALDLTARLLVDPGESVWLEDPGYLGARGAMTAAGARLIPVPVDADGMDVGAGQRLCADARVAYVTPSHQYPMGVTMSLERRLALLDWAHSNGAWIIEDDYDSEYRFVGRPLTALQGLDGTHRVVYVGTFSKTMLPSLRLAYLVVPPDLVDAFQAALRHTGQWAPQLLQWALADFIEQGHFASHLRRMRALYAARREYFVSALHGRLGAYLDIVPSEAGMQLCALLKDGLDDAAISRFASKDGVVARAIGQHYLSANPRSGLLLGFAGVAQDTVDQGLDVLTAAVNRARDRSVGSGSQGTDSKVRPRPG